MRNLIIPFICCFALLCASCGPSSVRYYQQQPYDYDEGYWNDFGDEDFGDEGFGNEGFGDEDEGNEDEGGER
jgi:hypothetical protein